MKILHTSDWHLGHTIYNYDRMEEQKAMLEQMVTLVAEHKPDVFLLCGDVYHTSQPSSSVQTMFTDAMVKIHNAHPDMKIIVTAGNHDSGTKHEIFRNPWMALNVHVIGTLNKINSDEHIIEIPHKGYIIAIPYVNERNMPEGFFQELLEQVNKQNTENLPIIMTAHTTVSGCDFSGHDDCSEYVVGGIDSIDIRQFGDGYDYLALGHIHHAQYIPGSQKKARYSGTPLPVSFDETYDHSVTLIELNQHGELAQSDTISIFNPRPLVTLPSQGMATWEQAKQLLQEFPSDIVAYIRLNVEIDDFLPPEAQMEAINLTQGKKCRFCYINARRKEREKSETKILTVQEFQSEKPIDIARRYAEDSGVEFNHEMIDMFMEAQKMVEDEIRD
jgi:exonuclease SbcD